MTSRGSTPSGPLGFDLGVRPPPRPPRVLLWLRGRIRVLSALGVSPGTRVISSSFYMLPWRRVLCPASARLSRVVGLGGLSGCDSHPFLAQDVQAGFGTVTAHG